MKRLCFNNTNTSQVYFLSQSKCTSIINSKGLMEFVNHAARISDQCGCAAPQQASTRRSRLALLGAVRRCGCATLSHSYTLALGPVDPVPMVTIGWLLLECQSGLWSVLSDATVYYSRALPVTQSNLARSAPIATGAAGGYWGLPG